MFDNLLSFWILIKFWGDIHFLNIHIQLGFLPFNGNLTKIAEICSTFDNIGIVDLKNEKYNIMYLFKHDDRITFISPFFLSFSFYSNKWLVF